MNNYGWICPSCDLVYAPHIDRCDCRGKPNESLKYKSIDRDNLPSDVQFGLTEDETKSSYLLVKDIFNARITNALLNINIRTIQELLGTDLYDLSKEPNLGIESLVIIAGECEKNGWSIKHSKPTPAFRRRLDHYLTGTWN